MKSLVLGLMLVSGLFTAGGANATTYQPVAISGFNQDLIANGSGSPTSTTTISFDTSDPSQTTSPSYNNVFYAAGYNWCTGLQYGLPVNGVINSNGTSGASYQLASYTGNNVVFLNASSPTATITLNSPGTYSSLVMLATSGNGPTAFTATVNFSDGTSSPYSFNVPDWYNTAPAYAYRPTGRFNRLTSPQGSVCVTDETLTQPILFDNVITLSGADKSKLVTGFTVTQTSSGQTGIFALAGSAPTGAPSAPTSSAATSVTGTSFVANWAAASGATGYNLDVATDSNFMNLVSGYNNLSVGSVTTYNVVGLTPATTYYYRTRAANSNGAGFNSNTISLTTAAAPTAPTNVVATAGVGQISMAFGASTGTGTISYTATCNSSSQGAASPRSATGSSSPIIVTGTTAGASYTCSLVATDSNGSSSTASANGGGSVTPTAPPPSPAPIPTLSEWAKIMMMLLMILTVGWYGRRLKQR